MASSEKLAAAAEALVKATVSETESTSLAQGREKLQKLENVSQVLGAVKSSTDGISTDLKDLKLSTDDKLNTISQKLVDIDKHLADVADTLRQDAKCRRIEFALQHLDRGNFQYSQSEGYSTSYSKDLAKSILWNFLQGYGYYLPDEAHLGNWHYNESNEKKEKDRKDFRDKLVNQLQSILGSKPRVSKESNGRYCIRYA